MICRYCGCEKELIYHELCLDWYCQSCGGWMKEKYPIINYLGHRWYNLGENGYNGLSTLDCVSWISTLKRYGMVDRTLEVKL